MATETGENKYNRYGKPALDFIFTGTKKSLKDRSGNRQLQVTRDSVGTYVDENGVIQTAASGEARFDHDPETGESLGLLVEEARTNIKTYSEFVEIGGGEGRVVIVPNSEIAPDQSISATKIIPTTENNSHYFWNQGFGTTSGDLTHSLFAKAGGYDYLIIACVSNGVSYASFNLATGTIGTVDPGVAATITPLKNGWYRCTATKLGGASTYFEPYVAASDNTRVFSGDGTSGIYVWGAQLEAGSFPTSYIPTPATFTSRASTATYYDANGIIQTAAIDEARDDAYFPDENGVMQPAGLLLEEEKTNYVLYSDKMNSSVWWNYAYKISRTYNAGVAPDGTTTATLFTVNTELQQHYLSGNPPSLPSAIYTHSVFAKQGTGSYKIQLKIGSAGGAPYVRFDFSTEQVTTNSRARVEKFPNGWYRLSVTSNAASTSSQPYIMMINESGSDTYTGDGTSSFYVWGYQVEAGTSSSSYISTTTATVTRAADNSTSSTVTRAVDVVSITNSSIYDTEAFTIINEPFGVSAGSTSLSLVGPNIKRTTVYSTNLSQTNILNFKKKTDEFWRWRILGDSFGLPEFTTDGQVTVDWGDGTVETLTTSDHTFTDGGGYHEIGFRLDSGTYFRPYINDNANHDTKVVAVGPAPESMKFDGQRAFFACTNLEAFDAAVDLSGGTDLYRAWRSCSNLKSFPALDTSSITYFDGTWANCSSLTSFPLLNTATGTSFAEAWLNCTSLTSFPLLDTTSGTSFNYSWQNCTSLTSFPLIDTSSGTSFILSWYNCNSLTSFPAIDTSSGTSFQSAWQNCSSLTSFPLIDTSSAGIMVSSWNGCSSLTSFPQINTSSVTNFQGAWLNCTSLTSFPLIDTSSATNFQDAWYNCSGLTSFPSINTSSATNLQSSWFGCSGLTNFPSITTSNVTNFQNTWMNCSGLTSFPLLNTSSGTNFYRAWYNNNSLTSFPLIDTSSGTNFSNAWQDCSSLTSFPAINTSSGTSFSYTWRDCSSLTSFPAIDTSSGTNFTYAWYNNNSLTSFPLIDTSSGTNFSETWRNCTSLTSFPLINTSSGTNFGNTWYGCSSLTSFPLIDTSSGTIFTRAWLNCSSLTTFPANFFDSWTGTPGSGCFSGTWDGCSSLSATSVENILNSIDTSGRSAPASSVDITIDYDTGTGTPSVATAVTNLKSRGWTITLNGVAQ